MLNHIDLMGRMTKDPEYRMTQSEKPVCTFTIACERDGGAEKKTDFIDIVCFSATADFVSKWFHKGNMAAVSGRLQIREWKDKDGNNRRSAEINADHVYFGESKKRDETPASVQYTDTVDTDGDLPF